MNDELLGLAELAELYGVTKATASNWSHRHSFPQPFQHLKMGPVWRKSDILAWRPLPANPGYSGATFYPRCFFCGGKLIKIDKQGCGVCESGSCLETTLTIELKNGQVEFTTGPIF